MKAILIRSYGPPDVLEVVERPTPTPKAGEVLIENKAISINPYDCMARNGEMKMLTGFRFPKTLGCECAGEVVALGTGVTDFKPGDRVIAYTGRSGSYAQFISRPITDIISLPAGVSFEEGASLPIAGTSAFDCLNALGKVKNGSRVLINGAYGSLGSFAVQLAKLAGAHVTAVCSTPSVELVRALGADMVMDYTVTDILAQPGLYDIVLDTPDVWSFSRAKHMLHPNGVFIAMVPSPGRMLTMLSTRFIRKKFQVLFAAPTTERIAELAQWVAEKKIKVIVDRSYAADQIAEAHRYSESKRAKGKIIVHF